MSSPTSPQIFNEAKELLPGGVNSPVRAFRSVGGQPIVFDRVKGAYCWDVDNNKYIDYVGKRPLQALPTTHTIVLSP